MNFRIEAILSDGTIVPTTGVIDFNNPAIQQTTGTMLFRAVIPNPKILIYPGQFVKVIVRGAIRPDALAVPQTAVMQNENGTFVYTIENGIAKIKNVQAGVWYKDYWIIDSGLKAGDVVVAQGTSKVRNNQPVTIQTLLPGVK